MTLACENEYWLIGMTLTTPLSARSAAAILPEGSGERPPE